MEDRKVLRARGCRNGLLGCGGAFFLLTASVAGLLYWAQAQGVSESLRAVQLAPIPPQARGVRTAFADHFFSAECRIRFHAAPDVIESYIQHSPALQRIKPEQFSPKHRLLPAAEKQAIEDKDLDAAQADAAYHPANLAPWYAPRIVTAGRRWEIPWDKDQFHGEVIVDDAAGLVYIMVSRS